MLGIWGILSRVLGDRKTVRWAMSTPIVAVALNVRRCHRHDSTAANDRWVYADADGVKAVTGSAAQPGVIRHYWFLFIGRAMIAVSCDRRD